VKIFTCCLGLALLLLPGAALAEPVVVSYDSASLEARRLTGAGLTLVMDRNWLGSTRVREVRATGVPVGARLLSTDLPPKNLPDGASQSEWAELSVAYEISLDQDQGVVMARAFGPGADKVWLLFGRMPRRAPIDILAVGRDPVTGANHNCARMSFAWRGEWRLPRMGGQDPVRAIFNDSGPLRR